MLKLSSTYKDFIAEQIYLNVQKDVEDFWKEELKDFRLYEYPELNIDNKATKRQQQFSVYDIGSSMNKQIKNFARAEGLSIRSICFAAYAFMLYMTSYYNSFIVGLVENNRPLCEDGDKVLGCFLNTVPVKITVSKDMSWKDYINIIDEKLIKLKHYGRLPISKIIQYMDNNNLESYINNFFNFVDFHVYDQLDNKMNSEWEFGAQEYYKTEMPFDFICMHTANEFFLKVSYDPYYLNERQVNNYFTYYVTALCSILSKPGSIMAKTDLLKQIYGLDKFKLYTGKKIDYNKNNINLMFTTSVKKFGQSVAISFAGDDITYNELEDASNLVASTIYKNGIPKGSIIAVLVDRSPEMTSSMLGY